MGGFSRTGSRSVSGLSLAGGRRIGVEGQCFCRTSSPRIDPAPLKRSGDGSLSRALPRRRRRPSTEDRKSVVAGKVVTRGADLCGRRMTKKQMYIAQGRPPKTKRERQQKI